MDPLSFQIRHELPGWELLWVRLRLCPGHEDALAGLRREVAEVARANFEGEGLADHPTVQAVRKLFRAAGCDPTRYAAVVGGAAPAAAQGGGAAGHPLRSWTSTQLPVGRAGRPLLAPRPKGPSRRRSPLRAGRPGETVPVAARTVQPRRQAADGGRPGSVQPPRSPTASACGWEKGRSASGSWSTCRRAWSIQPTPAPAWTSCWPRRPWRKLSWQTRRRGRPVGEETIVLLGNGDSHGSLRRFPEIFRGFISRLLCALLLLETGPRWLYRQPATARRPWVPDPGSAGWAASALPPESLPLTPLAPEAEPERPRPWRIEPVVEARLAQAAEPANAPAGDFPANPPDPPGLSQFQPSPAAAVAAVPAPAPFRA